MSRSLHSSIEYLGGSKRWSRNDRDIDPEKSSIGEISSKISSRPDFSWMWLSPAAAWTRDCQRSLPRSQSKLSVCSARRSGTSSGSWILPKLTRPEAVRAVDFAGVREAAKEGPSTGLRCGKYARRSTRHGEGHTSAHPDDGHRYRQRKAQAYTTQRMQGNAPVKSLRARTDLSPGPPPRRRGALRHEDGPVGARRQGPTGPARRDDGCLVRP